MKSTVKFFKNPFWKNMHAKILFNHTCLLSNYMRCKKVKIISNFLSVRWFLWDADVRKMYITEHDHILLQAIHQKLVALPLPLPSCHVMVSVQCYRNKIEFPWICNITNLMRKLYLKVNRKGSQIFLLSCCKQS